MQSLPPPSLDGLISQRRVWRGQPMPATGVFEQPTGWPALDAALPAGGWPNAALSELLLPADGVGELQLLWPTLARLSLAKDAAIALIAPPYLPYPQAWHIAGVRLGALQVIRTKTPRDALWAAEQCLRSGACEAVLCWPQQADDRALRRLQVAAETGQALGFAFRPLKAALNPSPAALRIAIEASPRQLRVLKCRGGNPPARAIPFPHAVRNRYPEPAAHAAAESATRSAPVISFIPLRKDETRKDEQPAPCIEA
ncbi:translesion DNA synthesis-associated protein ImuA [Lysobacter terrae]